MTHIFEACSWLYKRRETFFYPTIFALFHKIRGRTTSVFFLLYLIVRTFLHNKNTRTSSTMSKQPWKILLTFKDGHHAFNWLWFTYDTLKCPVLSTAPCIWLFSQCFEHELSKSSLQPQAPHKYILFSPLDMAHSTGGLRKKALYH